MPTPILATKLYIPPPRPKVVLRPRLIQRLNESLLAGRPSGLTVISAPAGFGKSTLVSEWVAGCQRLQPPAQVAWLSLDEGDNDPARFLTYFIAALQTLAPNLGAGVLNALQSPQPPPPESILTSLLNEILTIPDNFVLVLDDYHVVEAKAVDAALAFLVEHLPRQMHLVIATREDPPLPLARLRAGGQLTELRAMELRFTASEAADFLNQVMGLNLSGENIAALETRTEGWIAGLQLAAISMQGRSDAESFIKSFTGSHHFVMDYLVGEVLQRQPESVQTFLLRTSILDRLCGPLCEAVLLDPATPGQETLEYLERVNLFIIPLDSERRWYRYHHLFADLLRQRLRQSLAASTGEVEHGLAELHIRASQWYEDNHLDIDAFRHAAAANDIERAERLIDGRGLPLHLQGAVNAILDWLGSLPTSTLNARPSLWWRYGSLLLVAGQTTGVQEKLDAAEAALHGDEANYQYLVGRIAAARAVLALTHYDAETMIIQSRRALENLTPKSQFLRANANWTLGYAYLFLKDYAAARPALMEAIALSQASRDIFTLILATIGLGSAQESESQLYQAAETYQRVIQWAGDQPQQVIHEPHLGLARIFYQWNDLAAAEPHAHQGVLLARQYDRVIDRFIICEVFLARLKLAQGDIESATAILDQASQSAQQPNFRFRLPEVAAGQVLTLLHQGNLTAAAHLAETYKLPVSLARVHLAQGNASAALALLEPVRQQAEARNWPDERLRVMVLQAVAHQVQGDKEAAAQVLADTLVLAEPGGYIRVFIDEGRPMAQLLADAAAQGLKPDYVGKLLAALNVENKSSPVSAQPLVEPLSQRELEILQFIAQGLSNQEISERLFLALSTIKGHIQSIFGKLQVQRRTEAVARARELGLL